MTESSDSTIPFIIWGKTRFITLRDKGVQVACKHPLLKDRRLIARGAYTLVFEGTTSVYKLTIDRLAYEMAEQQIDWRCRSLATTRSLHGTIGKTEQGIPIRLMEIERLRPLEHGSRARKTCLLIGRLARKSRHRFDSPAEQLRDIQSRIEDSWLSEALEYLCGFADTHSQEAVLDMHASNFMQRPASSEAVITDPFLDAAVRRQVQQHHLRKIGLPSDTLCI